MAQEDRIPKKKQKMVPSALRLGRMKRKFKPISLRDVIPILTKEERLSLRLYAIHVYLMPQQEVQVQQER